jgi:hypothetical protein
MENPFVKIREADPAKYPITVKCVVACLSEKNEEILKVREFSHSVNINFVTREYNSKKFSDDRNYVARLPSFHIYVKHGYRNTFYLNHACQIIQEIVQEYQTDLLKRTWHTFYTELRGYLNSTFKRGHEERRRIKDWL